MSLNVCEIVPKQRVAIAPAKTILVVEDDYNLNLAVCVHLESMGYDVLRAHDGTTGIRLAEERRPDLVLMDVCLPETNGFEVAATIRDDLEHKIPVVFVTGCSLDGLRERANEVGATAFLEKPFTDVEIRTAIQAATA